MPTTNYPLITGVGSSGGGGTWGSITGTLSSQTDLQAALDALEPKYSPSLNPDLYHLWSTDFDANDRGSLTVAVNAGGGSGQAVNNDTTALLNTTENAFGVIAFSLGTGTTARLSIYSSGLHIIGTSRIQWGGRAAMSVLSDGSNTHTVYLGICDNPGAGDVTDGVYFRYTHSVNGGRWQAIVAKAATRIAIDTGVSPTANTFQVFEIDVNQAGTEAKFYIDGALVATHSSGLPGSGDFTLFNCKMEKSTGTTGPVLYLDWLYWQKSRTTVR
jgi:hypothetical protein